MAAEFLREHGVDLEAELQKAQLGPELRKTKTAPTTSPTSPRPTKSTRSSRPPKSSRAVKARAVDLFQNVTLPSTPSGTTWDVSIADGKIIAITQHNPESPDDLLSPTVSNGVNGFGALLTPSLCHPHVHLDKAFLLSHPKHSHLQIQRGDFAEAMELTGKAKANFGEDDLLERGQRLIDESVSAGVTHMRAFVEVDAGVGTKCLDAGVKLKRRVEQEGRMKLQICAFAQLPLFSRSNDDAKGEVIRGLMEKAASMYEVDALGSTPYVESDRSKLERNITWLTDLSAEYQKHLDFHLDYNVDAATEPAVWHVLRTLKSAAWHERTSHSKTVVLGHCTRLTLFNPSEWSKLKSEIGTLPVSFCGLPTSDLYMMRPSNPGGRGTLPIPQLISEHNLNACIGMNNIGNAFTPHGSCDPLTLACSGVGIYQAGTRADATVLFESISTRAREAIGFGREMQRKERRSSSLSSAASSEMPTTSSAAGVADVSLLPQEGDRADLLLFDTQDKEGWRMRRDVAETVYLYDHCVGRRACLDGRFTA